MSRELIYQFLFSVALFQFAYSSCYMQLCFWVRLNCIGIIRSLDLLAIGLKQYVTLRCVTWRYVTLQNWLFTPNKNDYSTNATYGFRWLAEYKIVKRKCARILSASVIKQASFANILWAPHAILFPHDSTFVDEEGCVTSPKNVCVGGYY